MNCPKCGSNDVARVPVIFESGTRTETSSGPAGGFAYSGGHVVPFIGRQSSETFSQTKLAARLSPPIDPRSDQSGCFPGIAMLATFCIVFFGTDKIFDPPTDAAVLIGIFAAALGLGVYFGAKRLSGPSSQEVEIFNNESSRWLSSWICLRCGVTWNPDERNDQALSQSRVNSLRQEEKKNDRVLAQARINTTAPRRVKPKPPIPENSEIFLYYADSVWGPYSLAKIQEMEGLLPQDAVYTIGLESKWRPISEII